MPAQPWCLSQPPGLLSTQAVFSKAAPMVRQPVPSKPGALSLKKLFFNL
jgi:hypothetical protein